MLERWVIEWVREGLQVDSDVQERKPTYTRSCLARKLHGLHVNSIAYLHGLCRVEKCLRQVRRCGFKVGSWKRRSQPIVPFTA